MLGKLFKYEFPAIGRKLGPLFIAWAAASALFGLSIGGITGDTNFLSVLVIMIYVMVTVAVSVMTLILIIQRYRNSMLGNEAYFNLTLPVSMNEQIANKTLSSLVWTTLTTAGAILSALIISLFSGNFGTVMRFVGEGLGEFFRAVDLSYSLILIEVIILSILSVVKSTLAIYAAMTIGHQAAKRTALLSIGAYIGLLSAESVIGNLMIRIGFITDFENSFGVNPVMTHSVLVASIIVTLLISAAYFMICKYFMEKKLNLA